jgi:hypothetical protein
VSCARRSLNLYLYKLRSDPYMRSLRLRGRVHTCPKDAGENGVRRALFYHLPAIRDYRSRYHSKDARRRVPCVLHQNADLIGFGAPGLAQRNGGRRRKAKA